VFDAYHQVSQRQQKHSPGTGLGLAISQQLAHAMGGHISVTSELHQGSQFDLNVILEQSKVPQEPTQFNTQNPIEFPQLSLNRILIVDDSDINLKVAQAYLQTTQAHLTLCNNGQQALKEFQAQPVDMVLIDLQMPELDGLEVCRQMRLIEQSLQRPKCGIILHTADSRPEIIVTATKAGVDYCLFKPYTQTQLLQAMGLSLAINRPDSGSGSGAESASETESGLILDSESEPNTPIRLANDPSLEALKGAFFQQTTTHLQQCVHHLETHAMSDFSALLHQLIGSTSLFGAHELHATLTQMNVIVNSLEESIALEAEDSLEVEDSLKVEDSLEVEDSGEDTDSLKNQEKWAEHHTKTMNNRELERLMLLAQQQLKAYESHG
jgi:CheY-like chemotaxis protein